jgi:hypothetical protein
MCIASTLYRYTLTDENVPGEKWRTMDSHFSTIVISEESDHVTSAIDKLDFSVSESLGKSAKGIKDRLKMAATT